ncbi:hypothetical protein CN100_01190 [Sinorhizobium meliloti]|uniref:hypothetical protein n=1 Tax=Sinorhizobium TaxID=28105 RepID=UPI000FD2972F|nr:MULTISPECIES: hypothetical protein [Sinorhizobium]MDW9473478.1 hypothetical protein [Sinorhizobium meliloti]MQV46527.1 hypothetical protein [Sinorhizobium medicae]MQV55973.1 hypothetical protein [Sinorhizobium medicae]MQV72028.1 hypothetical protein [Sinorhizobium medicae]RVI81712.1 hypothetical protein CN188_13640 [Sinorhizobium meliloti]
MSLTVYNYNPSTFEYTGSSEADESPLEPGVYLIPAYATEIAPPEFIPGHIFKWAGSAWVAEAIPSQPSIHMPALSARQIRLGLVSNGFALAQVTASIDAMPEGVEKETAQIEWEYATTFDRTHPLIAMVGGVLGLSDEQIDTMWAAAEDL